MTDFEENIKNILALDPEELKRDAIKYINNHSNIYCFCKDSAERYLERYRGKLRMIINRPSLIISCDKEPIAGWCDSISAAGAFAYPAGLGLASRFFLPNQHMDLIPADIVCASVLVTTCWAAKTPTPEFNVFHNC